MITSTGSGTTPDRENGGDMKGQATRSVRLALAVSLLVCCVGCDQTTKYVATKNLRGNLPFSCLSNTVRLEYALNPGGFLSLGSNLEPWLRFCLFVGFNAILVVGTVCVLIVKWDMPLVNFVALLLVVAGGIGNAIDRVFHGGLVTDFLNLGIGPVRTGVFNVADMALLIGVVTFLLICHVKPRPSLNHEGGRG
jgi:signal peptidase II